LIRCATHRPLKNHPWRPYEGSEELNLNPERSQNVPIFAALGYYGEKSNDFLGTSGEAAEGFPRGAHLLEAPLGLTSLVTFLFSDKKVTPIIKQKTERQTGI